MATCRSFVRGKEKYSLSEKKHLGELISNHKEKYDKELKGLEGKARYIVKIIKIRFLLLFRPRPPPLLPKEMLVDTTFFISMFLLK